MKLNGLVNCGFCQGVANKSIIEIGDNVLRIDIDIEDNRKNPQSDKKRIYRIPFIAKDSVAEKIRKGYKTGCLLLLQYRLKTHFRFNTQIGVGRFERELLIEDVCFKENTNHISYLNRGLFQCEFIEISMLKNSEGIYKLDTVAPEPNSYNREHQSFIVFGSFGEVIKQTYKPGQQITVEYKLEKSVSKLPNGETEVFTNCVVEKIL